MRAAVRRAFDGVKDVPEFEVSVKPLPPKDEVPERRFLDVLDSLLTVPTTKTPEVPVGLPEPFDYFVGFRGKS
jgi:hypothetical protein